jgi:hypothetical protein
MNKLLLSTTSFKLTPAMAGQLTISNIQQYMDFLPYTFLYKEDKMFTAAGKYSN